MADLPRGQVSSGVDSRTFRLLDAVAEASPTADALVAARRRAGNARSLADLSGVIHTASSIRNRLLASGGAIGARTDGGADRRRER